MRCLCAYLLDTHAELVTDGPTEPAVELRVVLHFLKVLVGMAVQHRIALVVFTESMISGEFRSSQRF
jgi:hypothetical protein